MKRLALPALSVVVAFSASFAADGKALFQQKRKALAEFILSHK